jgi:hypothetical protein
MSTWLDQWDWRYTDRVRLLVEILPVLAQEPRFALKGGTAINPFEHDLPRLSVDIDLAWLPVHDFAEDAALIADALRARPQPSAWQIAASWKKRWRESLVPDAIELYLKAMVYRLARLSVDDRDLRRVLPRLWREHSSSCLPRWRIGLWIRSMRSAAISSLLLPCLGCAPGTRQAIPWSDSGNERTKLPVADWIAAINAGATGGRPGSPTPPSGDPISTIPVTTSGISCMRSTG